MKSWAGIFLSILMLVAVSGIISACAQGQKESNVTVTFIYYSGNFDARTLQKGETVELPDDCQRTGYIFEYWYTGSGQSFDPSAGSLIDALIADCDITLYAKWSLVNYTITYHADGGSNSPDNPLSYTIETLNITLNSVSKSGCMFAGWFDNAELDGEPLTRIPSGSHENLDLYAKWDILPQGTFAVVYHLDGGDNHPDNPAEYTSGGQAIALQDPSKRGYEFMGWQNGAGKAVMRIEMDAYGDIALYALWRLKTYNIVYIIGEGGINHQDNPIFYTVESETITLKNPWGSSRIFAEWQDAQGDSVTKIEKGSTGHLTLTAVWVKAKFRVVFETGQGGSNVSPQDIEEGGQAARPASEPSKTGYIFDGWYETKECNGAGFDFDKPISMATTLFAKWTPKVYSIEYHFIEDPEDAGDNFGNPATYTIETDTIILKAPATDKEGCIFGGWYLNTDFAGSKTERIEKGSTGDMDLYAKWIAFTVECLIYTPVAGGYEVSAASNALSGDAVISDTYQGLPVIAVAAGGFKNCVNLLSIDIPDSVTEIGAGAFYNCNQMNYVQMPANLAAIGASAFADCRLLKRIVIPDKVSIMGGKSFAGCVGLNSVTIPASVASMGCSIFEGSAIAVIYIESSGSIVPEGWHKEWSANVYDDPLLIPGITRFTPGLEFTEINGMFCAVSQGAAKEISVIIPAEYHGLPVKRIADAAFKNNDKITDIAVPQYVEEIGREAFSGCIALGSPAQGPAFKIDGKNTGFAYSGGVLFTKNFSQLICYPAGNTAAFYDIPSGVVTVRAYAFAGCLQLSSLGVPSTTTYIQANAFAGCGALSVYVDYAKEDGLPQSWAEGWDNGCTVSIIWNEPEAGLIYGFYYFNTEAFVMDGGGARGRVTIPAAILNPNTNTVVPVTAIYANAFLSNNSITEAVIPASVKTLGISAFEGCGNLRKVTVQSGSRLNSIEMAAFKNCRALTKITLENAVSLKSIGDSVFAACTNIEDIVIPSNVIYMGKEAFYGWEYTQSIYIKGTEQWTLTWNQFWKEGCGAKIYYG